MQLDLIHLSNIGLILARISCWITCNFGLVFLWSVEIVNQINKNIKCLFKTTPLHIQHVCKGHLILRFIRLTGLLWWWCRWLGGWNWRLTLVRRARWWPRILGLLHWVLGSSVFSIKQRHLYIPSSNCSLVISQFKHFLLNRYRAYDLYLVPSLLRSNFFTLWISASMLSMLSLLSGSRGLFLDFVETDVWSVGGIAAAGVGAGGSAGVEQRGGDRSAVLGWVSSKATSTVASRLSSVLEIQEVVSNMHSTQIS